jgi:single-strand DNA-binding protein
MENDMPLPRVNGEFGVVMEPTLRFATSGTCVLTLRLKAAKRVRDSNGNWSDGPTPLFIDGTLFGKLAENTAESVKKGSTVVVEGELEQQEWADRETGEKRSKVVVIIDKIGISTRWSTLTTNESESSGDVNGQGEPQEDLPPF